MKRTGCATFTSLLCTLILLWAAGPAHAWHDGVAKIDAGPTTLDGPVSRDGVFPVSPNTLPTVILGDFKFNDPSPNETNCGPDGWTSVDLNAQDDMYFHVDDFAGLGGGDFGRLLPLEGSRSLWCGARTDTGPPLCEYAFLPGYGNSWDQGWCTIACLPVTGNVDVNFDMTWDMEPGYDYVAFEYDECDNNWQQFAGGAFTYDDFGTVLGETHTIPGAGHSGSIRIRIVAHSDGAFSDEDGFFNTDGACVIDNLSVTDANGTVLALENFEGEAVGAQASNDWNACLPASFGDFACLFPAMNAIQEVNSADCSASCVWGFFCGSPDTYTCGPGLLGIQGSCDGSHLTQNVVPYGSENDGYLHNEIWSPWMTFSGAAGSTTHMEFDVYRDLTVDNLVFYDWRVRTRSVAGGCPDIGWNGDNFVYYGGVDWHTHRADLDPFLGPTPAEIQVALGVRDLCGIWCGSWGSGSCHSHSPMFDNVLVYRTNTQAWVVDDIDLFMDAFPDDGTTTGTVTIASSDDNFVEVMVTEPEFGIDNQMPSGPAVFLHVRNLPGKSGAVVSGGSIQWPEVPSMSTPDWTVLQMSNPNVQNHRYRCAVNNSLYTPGDTIAYYFSARDGGGGWSYYSHQIGRTDTEALAQANPMEAACLPAGGAATSGILYVDAYSGYGAEPYFMTAFEALGLEVDRFDLHGSSSQLFLDNSLGEVVVQVSPQLDAYDVIVWNTGTHGPISDADYSLLWEWLNNATGYKALYLSGDDAADQLLNSTSPAASDIVSTYINFTVPYTSHMDATEPTSPLVLGTVGGIFDEGTWVDSLVALGTTPAMNDFDVLQPAGSAVLEAAYSGNPLHGAVVSQTTLNPQAAQVKVVLSGFSFHHIRDNTPQNGYVDVMDRYEHLRDILEWMGTLSNVPTGDTADPRYHTTLAQNVPNPFNPVTTIAYSLPEHGPARIVIYDVAGAVVRTLVDETDQPAGQHVADWDGRNDRGVRVASGVYFYRMSTTGFDRTRKMVLLK